MMLNVAKAIKITTGAVLFTFLLVVGSTEAFGYTEKGIASWYSSDDAYYANTASGRSMFSLEHGSEYFAAHRWLPFGKRVRVTNLVNNKSVTVTILDRGPSSRFSPPRIIDLSRASFSKIADRNKGLINVKIETIN